MGNTPVPFSFQERHADNLIQNQHYQVSSPADKIFICLFFFLLIF